MCLLNKNYLSLIFVVVVVKSGTAQRNEMLKDRGKSDGGGGLLNQILKNEGAKIERFCEENLKR